MRDTKEHREPALPVFRTLLLLLAALVMTVGLTPRALAADTAQSEEARYVIPLGQAVGIKLFSQGVLVVGLSDGTNQGHPSPAKACGLEEGDIITHMNGTPVSSIEQVQAVLRQLNDPALTLTVLRADQTLSISTQAVRGSGGVWQLGAWIRDSMAGIGTLTFVEPATGLFGTLGHGINDVDTAVLMKLQSGAITPATVASVVKGTDGRPGELRGVFSSREELGDLYANTEQGVFGHLDNTGAFTGRAVPTAKAQEIHRGQATILANVSGDTVEEYTVEIQKVNENAPDTRDMMLKVTDQRLLTKTGGIVQGMSGSPILQDGKLIGAVTHVLVNDPTKGYGIFIEHMLDAAE